jgi:putative pyrimidine permease RutG
MLDKERLITGEFLPGWKVKSAGVILPEERLPAGQTLVVGLQHVVAMFGATVLAPILVGFDPNVVVLFSGIGTLIFFVAVGGRVPSYLGSSFSFIAAVVAATAYSGQGANPNIGIALSGVLAAGVVYMLIGVGVVIAGHGWVERLMPPAVTGAVVAVIGLNLAPIAIKSVSGGVFDTGMALATVAMIGAIAVFAPGFWQRIPILIGGIASYLTYWVLANGLGLGKPIDFQALAAVGWLGTPNFSAPVFDARAIVMIAPVAVVLVAENLGHLKALSAMMGRNLDGYLGRAFIGDGIATMVAGSGGGIGVTTYAENIGVMGITNIYSTLVFVTAAGFAILLSFSPKFGALILTIPAPVIGGLSITVFGLIAATAGRIWVQNNVDFSRPGNLITVGVSLVAGAGDLTLDVFGFGIGGIGTASLAAIVLHQLLQDRSSAKPGQQNVVGTWGTHSELARATSHSAVEETAASIAHELKQPLAAVTTSANAAMRWLEKTPPDLVSARAALTRVVNSAHRADDQIQSIRALFTRGDRNRVLLDVNKVILGTLRALGEELQAHQIMVRPILFSDALPVLANPIQLQQVLLNLTINAIEAMTAVTDRQRTLCITSEIQEPEYVVVSMEDSGSGIDAKHLDRIFDAFFTTKSRGMGVGLSICRSIIESHGGRLWVSPGNPFGTVFRFTLPLKTP